MQCMTFFTCSLHISMCVYISQTYIIYMASSDHGDTLALGLVNISSMMASEYGIVLEPGMPGTAHT